MFDANMRHLPKGHKFIAKVWGIKSNTILYKHGVRKEDVCLCTMLEEESENPMVKFHLEYGDVVVSSHGVGLFAYHMLYWATVEDDGTISDYLNDKDLNEAKQLMENLK